MENRPNSEPNPEASQQRLSTLRRGYEMIASNKDWVGYVFQDPQGNVVRILAVGKEQTAVHQSIVDEVCNSVRRFNGLGDEDIKQALESPITSEQAQAALDSIEFEG